MTRILNAPGGPGDVYFIEPERDEIVRYPTGLTELDLNALEKKAALAITNSEHTNVDDSRFGVLPGHNKLSEATSAAAVLPGEVIAAIPRTGFLRRIELLIGIHPAMIRPDIQGQLFAFALTQSFRPKGSNGPKLESSQLVTYSSKRSEGLFLPTRSMHQLDRNFYAKHRKVHKLMNGLMAIVLDDPDSAKVPSTVSQRRSFVSVDI